MAELTIAAIRSAAAAIAPHVLRTPVLEAVRPDAVLLCKAESLQPVGAFKLRGAFHAMQQLPTDCPGVVAHSSGNHAQAVARAARLLGLPAVVVMPSDAPPRKRAATEADGAEVVEVSPDSEERERTADQIARERGLVPIPPYDDLQVATGQGTAALELLDDVGPIDRFYAPVSGGGLMAGCAVAVHALAPECEIIGVEPSGCERLARSLASGSRELLPTPTTLADGLRVRRVGAVTWPVLKEHVARSEGVTDDELLDAMAFAARTLRLVLEPSGAASLAVALREGRGRCGVLLSGGNAEPALLARALERPVRWQDRAGLPS